MAIALDTATGSSNTGASSLTYSHTCTGSNLVLLVGVYSDDGDTTTGVTFNSVALTLIAKTQNGGADSSWTSLWYLVGPATGAHNVVISRSGTNSFLRGDSASYTGVSSLSSVNASNSGSGTAATLSISATTIYNNSWVVGFFTNRQAPTVNSGITARNGLNGSGGVLSGIGDSNGPKTPAGSYTMIANAGGTSNMGGVIAAVTPYSGISTSGIFTETVTCTEVTQKSITKTIADAVSGADATDFNNTTFGVHPAKNSSSWSLTHKS